MTFRMALKHIRRHAPETEQTFRAICRNRGCRPVRDWSIRDLAKRGKLSFESAKRRYNRHLARLHEIFRVPAGGYLWRDRARSRRGSGAMRGPDTNPRPKGTKR